MIMRSFRTVVFSVLRGRGEAGRAKIHLMAFGVSVRAPRVPPDSTTPRRAAPPSMRAPRVPLDSTTPRRVALPSLRAATTRVPPAHTAYSASLPVWTARLGLIPELLPSLACPVLQDHILTNQLQSHALHVPRALHLLRKVRLPTSHVHLALLDTTALLLAVPCAALARLDVTAPKWTAVAATKESRARLAHTRSIPRPSTKTPASNARRAPFVPTTAPSPRSRATLPVVRSLRYRAF
jgi:hypothetical protein